MFSDKRESRRTGSKSEKGSFLLAFNKKEEIPPDRMLASKRFQEERSVKGGVLRDVTKITECRS